MCGISALFSCEKAIDLSAIIPMTDLIAHRGPDDEGFAFFPHNSLPILTGGKDTQEAVYQAPYAYCPANHHTATLPPGVAALGHRRLSILDLSPAGHQPMSSQDGQQWISYNGEIYNYIEIKQELELAGYVFCSQSDTEVILAAYQHWGKHCLSKFNGMFAFIIYDWKRRLVFAARDRFGVKPLYYWRNRNVLAFASEIKAFTALPDWKAILNKKQAYDFLNWGITDHSQDTCFAHVHQLKAGCYMEFYCENMKLQQTRWYDLKPSPFAGSFAGAAQEFRSLLEDAVRLRLRADVPVGSCLSGGLDSSSIVCLVNRLLHKEGKANLQKTFSACSESARHDEKHYVDLVTSYTSTESHFIYPSRDQLFNDLDKVIWQQDEPFGSTSIYAQWLVFKLAQETGVKVMLDGQGADEQLGGYHGFMGNHLYDLFTGMHWRTCMKEAYAMFRLHQTWTPVKQAIAKFLPLHVKHLLRGGDDRSLNGPSWLNGNLLGISLEAPFKGIPDKSFFHQSRLQILQSNLPMLLRFEDRDSMAHSIESRTPFLDYRLVEFTLGLPNEYKLHQGWTKRVLREGMKHILPEPIRQRVDKIAFATAEEEWLRINCSDRFRYLLRESIERSGGLISPSAVDILEDIIAGKKPFSFLPFRLICFGKWLNLFGVEV